MQIIKKFLEQHQITETTLALGVSGGADSLALALLFHQEYPNHRLIALTVDHGLRPTSRKEAEYVAQVMQQNGIEHHILVWKGKKPLTGIEEQARIARYELLCDWCKAHQVRYLAIAHHLYDQAETFLMRLERGSGLFGLSAMQPITTLHDITILRPLLNIEPDKLKLYLEKQNITWIEDESNQCSDFLRVKMRQFLPLLQEKTGITPNRLAQAAENLQNVRNFIEDSVRDIIKNDVHFWSESGVSFDFAAFLNWHTELRYYVLNNLICRLGNLTYAPEATAVRHLCAELASAQFESMTLGGVYFCLQDFRIWLIKEHRGKNITISESEWQTFSDKIPYVRGLKIPTKLKQALIYEKK